MSWYSRRLREGCALVVLEALACGLPVIITPNTGSLEFVRDGYQGFGWCRLPNQTQLPNG